MQKDINLRYQTATEMLRDLSRAIKNPNGDFDLKTLDSLNIQDKIDLIKIDVEGHEIEVLKGGIETIKKSQFDMLEKISGFTKDQAKAHLLEMLDGDLTHEKAVKILEFEQQFKEETDQKARDH